ncbi:MAG: tRNA 2-thiouridine(34) synthase MnmA [Waddliaceae bacterium]|nr:tRNA 2-thiouridine(34) synthase MnmA [Waddliaceae bacterium]MBT3578502.1 tRNA 2-thiouridine(34) synthase MnmA [Waddliaceae bacterium]MBT4445143.1 tRNA 2-thiouridine(34) synthase MnmA [Waddliaceae bacterium]MBT6927961.1 tRNA 2-thiouridine(34) synthase MnmA [Waddliaceae bacterium]MBT7263923.1 tRNA 2-thiouridine(34) synthase MnmA [Waddliaceae bacterium]
MDKKKKKTVVVGMSGGVDSSVAALILKEQGYNVIGMFMKNWDDTADEECPAAEDHDDVVAICEQIDIPFYTVNFTKEYWDNVFESFLEDCKKGITPNPDVLCNREIKFKVFLEKAMELGADYLATGHYCRNIIVDGKNMLARGVDNNKDQSYFLYTIKSAILEKVLFPIGELKKDEVRRIAEKHDLATAKKKDSMGICFIGKRNFKEFVGKYLGFSKGEFQKLDGTIVGNHDGIAYYTIGQRKGLGIGGPGEPWFVVEKDPEKNVVYVEQGEDHPALYSSKLTAKEISWVGDKPKTIPYKCTAKIRYRQADAPCTITILSDHEVEVEFDATQKAVTPGQSVVFYDGELCLGGAVIIGH